MDDRSKNYIDNVLKLMQDLCDAVGNQSSGSVKNDVTTLKSNLASDVDPGNVEQDEGG